jgi:hypothetical protein
MIVKFFVSFISFDWVMLYACNGLLSYVYCCCAEAMCTILIKKYPLNISKIIMLGPYFVGAFVKLRRTNISFVISFRLSVHAYARPSAWNDSAATGRIFIKFDIWICLRNLLRKFKFLLKYDNNNAYFIWKFTYIYNHTSRNSS